MKKTIMVLIMIMAMNVTAMSGAGNFAAGADTYYVTRILLEGLTHESQQDKSYWRRTLEPSLVSAIAIAAPVGIMVGATEETDDWFYGVALTFGFDMAIHTIYYFIVIYE